MVSRLQRAFRFIGRANSNEMKTPIHGRALVVPCHFGHTDLADYCTEDGRELFVVCVERGYRKSCEGFEAV